MCDGARALQVSTAARYSWQQRSERCVYALIYIFFAAVADAAVDAVVRPLVARHSPEYKRRDLCEIGRVEFFSVRDLEKSLTVIPSK